MHEGKQGGNGADGQAEAARKQERGDAIVLATIVTARLILRPRGMQDFDACLAMNSDPVVMAFVGGMPDDPVAYREELARRMEETHPPGLGYWSVFARAEPDRLIGWVSLVPCDDAPGSDIEIGWRIVPSDWGKGYAPEAAAALLRHAFVTVGLDRVIATVHPENIQSFRVAEKAGLRFAGDGDYLGEPCKVYEAMREGFEGKEPR